MKTKIILFSGGRGASAIAKELSKLPEIDLHVIVNAYDDGLSTGRIRKFFDGILGPSDVRKSIYTLLSSDLSKINIAKLLEYRLDKDISSLDGLMILDFLALRSNDCIDINLKKLFLSLNYDLCLSVSELVLLFLDYIKNSGKFFDFSDTSVGNILFAGAYLKTGDFNMAGKYIESMVGSVSSVDNVTTSEARVLVALKADGQFLCDESSIVSPQNDVLIEEIFLLKDYLNNEQHEFISKISSVTEKKNFLRSLESFPDLNHDLIKIISEADVIIYGPGTQYSSLLPSYLSKDLARLIVNNKNARKIYVSNVCYDHDIKTMSVNNLLDTFLYYMNAKGVFDYQLSDFIDAVYVHADNENNIDSFMMSNYLKFDRNNFPKGISIVFNNWESESGKHSGEFIVNKILSEVESVSNRKLSKIKNTISIIIPVYNEINKIKNCIDELEAGKYLPHGISKEVIFVDGGSTDGTFEYLNSLSYIKLFKVPRGKFGRGAALSLGIAKSKGSVILCYPADCEYSLSDLNSLTLPIFMNDFKCVFGSRAIKIDNMEEVYKKVYPGKFLVKYISRFGTQLLSYILLFKFRRYISDPLTGVFALDGNYARSINLIESSLAINIEIIKSFRRAGELILEVPVKYYPRPFNEGKKTTTADGVKSLLCAILG